MSHPCTDFPQEKNLTADTIKPKVSLEGLSLELNIPMRNKLIKKTKNTTSQTKLTKSQRSKNVENTFVASPALSEINAIGIVDDVLTTGATIREICKEIIKVNETIEITIFTLGVAKHE